MSQLKSCIDLPQYLTWQCPCCGEYLYTDSQMYIDHTGTVLGCDNCAKRVEADQYFKEAANG